MNKISVIIPVYNLENDIEATVKSVLCQTYKNIEIILVNDGSSDKSPEILAALSKTDNRIKVFHKKNGGVSSARNLGLENATGDYVAFVDGDDLIEKNTLEAMLDNINEYGSDMCICSKYFINDCPSGFAAIDKRNDDLFSSKELLKQHLLFKVTSSLWLCLIKRKCIKNTRFDEQLHALEDWKFLFDVFAGNAKNISVLKKPFYHYLIREGSASHSVINERKMSCFKMVDNVKSKIKACHPEYINTANCLSGLLILHLSVIAANNDGFDEKYKKEFKAIARRNLKYILKEKAISKRKKLYMLMLSINPQLYCFMYNLKYKLKGLIK